jgi:hypothetical protein
LKNKPPHYNIIRCILFGLRERRKIRRSVGVRGFSGSFYLRVYLRLFVLPCFLDLRDFLERFLPPVFWTIGGGVFVFMDVGLDGGGVVGLSGGVVVGLGCLGISCLAPQLLK